VEENGFIQAVRKSLHDEAARLIYADWLTERGDTRADFLRLECTLRRMTDRNPEYPVALAAWLGCRARLPSGWLESLGWRVNGLLLPRLMVDLLADGRWRFSDMDPVCSAWGVFTAFSLEMMRSETLSYPRWPTPEWLGKPDNGRPPGDIDMKLAVLIGGLDGSDELLALDYRVSLEQPRVLFLERLFLSTAPWWDNRWVEVAPNFQAFWG
jgi:uncharacterized protein (TIGR02996 family)